MTPDRSIDPDDQQAGPRLDRLVHQVAFGPAPADDSKLPPYSSDITEAQRVSERFGGIQVEADAGSYRAKVEHEDATHEATAPTPELAMCRAALKAGLHARGRGG